MGTQPTPAVASSDRERLAALARMSFPEQLTALERGECTLREWRGIRTAQERVELLCGLTEDEQLDALRRACFTLGEWCAFARRHPHRVFMLGGEYAFIQVTTPEWCER